jgi:phosphoribosylformylglycinamidine synthase
LADVLVAASRAQVVAAAHDVADGGLAQSLVDMSLAAGVGMTVELPTNLDPFVLLFAETVARAVVALPDERAEEFVVACRHRGVPVTRLGSVGGDDLTVTGLFTLSLRELAVASTGVFPALFG